jgi:hypothetical protein
MQHPLCAKVGINFVDKRQLLSWYSFLTGESHGVKLVEISLLQSPLANAGLQSSLLNAML